MVGPTLSLLQSAFGISSTPYTVLQCDASSTPAQLRSAYRAAALRYHPDRALCRRRCDDCGPVAATVATAEDDNDEDDDNGNGEGVGGSSSTTLKFQAVSAAYRVLMDDSRRSCYDKTGKVCEDDDCNHGDGFPSPSAARPPNEKKDGRFTSDQSSCRRRRHRGGNQNWEFFYRSLLNEMVGVGMRHAESANAYRGSQSERRDVLRYHNMFQGDMRRVIECVPYGKDVDVARWMRDIINPAVACKTACDLRAEQSSRATMRRLRRKGKREKRTARVVGNYSVPTTAKQRKRTILEDSSEEESDDEGEDIAAAKQRKRTILEDSSEEESDNKGEDIANVEAFILEEESDDKGEDIASPNNAKGPFLETRRRRKATMRGKTLQT